MTRSSRAGIVAAALLVAAAPATGREAGAAGDPEGAARLYKVARRLVAEGSPNAAPSLAKVYEMDPKGALADDALVEQARLLPVATWPGELGRIAAPEKDRAVALLDKAIDGLPGGDRADEARVLRALLRLEPLPGHDPSRARLDLLAVAQSSSDARWRAGARLAIAWIDERSGERERARSAYQRLAIDDRASPPGARALAGLARLLLRDGRPGRAAALLEEVVEAGPDAVPGASIARDLAVRSALRRERAGGQWTGGTVVTSQTGLRGVAAAARLRDGGILLLDRKEGAVVELGPDGAPRGRWALDDVQAIAEDPLGRRFAAAGEQVFRLLPSGAVPVAQLGPFAPVSAMAADGWGRLYVLDRRGEKLGALDPGSPSPSLVGPADRDARLAGLAWDGERLVSLDAKSKSVVEVLANGSARPAFAVPCEKPQGLAADPAGEIAVLDSKTDEVVLLGPDGEVRDRLPIRSAGLERADLIVLGPDGSLDLLMEGSGTAARFP